MLCALKSPQKKGQEEQALGALPKRFPKRALSNFYHGLYHGLVNFVKHSIKHITIAAAFPNSVHVKQHDEQTGELSTEHFYQGSQTRTNRNKPGTVIIAASPQSTGVLSAL